MYAYTKSKAKKLTITITQLFPSYQHWDAANPGLVTSRRAVQVSQIETTVPQRPHIARQGKDSYFQVPIDATAGWAVSPFDTRSSFNS